MQNVLDSLPRAPTTRAGLWTGRALTALIALFLFVDAGGKIARLAAHVEGTRQAGFSVDAVRPLGLVLALSVVLHLARRTELVGAVLVTAYLGGATATLVHAGTPCWFPIAMGVLLWVAYALRRPRVRALALSSLA